MYKEGSRFQIFTSRRKQIHRPIAYITEGRERIIGFKAEKV